MPATAAFASHCRRELPGDVTAHLGQVAPLEHLVRKVPQLAEAPVHRHLAAARLHQYLGVWRRFEGDEHHRLVVRGRRLHGAQLRKPQAEVSSCGAAKRRAMG